MFSGSLPSIYPSNYFAISSLRENEGFAEAHIEEQFPPVTAEVRVRCSAGVESVSAGLRSLSQILNSPQY